MSARRNTLKRNFTAQPSSNRCEYGTCKKSRHQVGNKYHGSRSNAEASTFIGDTAIQAATIIDNESKELDNTLIRMCDTSELLCADDTGMEYSIQNLESAMWMDVANMFCKEAFINYREEFGDLPSSTTDLSTFVSKAARAYYLVEVLPKELEKTGAEVIGIDEEYNLIFDRLSEQQKTVLGGPVVVALAAQRYELVHALASQYLEDINNIKSKN